MRFMDKIANKMNKYKFFFRGKEIRYEYEWLDNDTFTFCFGDGELEFIDKDGDKYFILVEYQKDNNKFIFQSWYEYQVVSAEEGYLTELEKSNIKELMKRLMDNMFINVLAIV